METTPDHKLQKLVNSSGFPLQIGLKQKIETTFNYSKWKVSASEHPWKNIHSGENGFIDLVLINQHETETLVVECKRVKDAEWIFLCPHPSLNPPMRRHAKAWVNYTPNNETKSFNWLDLNPEPVTPQSEFCTVHGQDAKSKPMLERVAAELVEATEALATEEYYLKKNEYHYLNVFYSIIVTTAELKICKFDPNKVSIKNGEIDNCEFESVPYLRFRKSLTARLNDNPCYNSIAEASKSMERTVFVINSEHFIDFLSEWESSNLPFK